jgi:hypothetical protein
MVSHLPAGHSSTTWVVHIVHNLKLQLFQHTSIHISWDMDLSIQIFITWMCVEWIHAHHTHVLKKCMVKLKSMSHGYAQKNLRMPINVMRVPHSSLIITEDRSWMACLPYFFFPEPILGMWTSYNPSLSEECRMYVHTNRTWNSKGPSAITLQWCSKPGWYGHLTNPDHLKHKAQG